MKSNHMFNGQRVVMATEMDRHIAWAPYSRHSEHGPDAARQKPGSEQYTLDVASFKTRRGS